KLRERLEEELKHYPEEELKEQLVSHILERHSMTPPPAMVDPQTRYLMERYGERDAGGSGERPTTEEARKAFESRAERQIQATLAIEKISQQEKIETSDHEVQERVDYLGRGGGERAKTIREYYSRPEARDDLRAQLIFDRTLSFLL